VQSHGTDLHHFRQADGKISARNQNKKRHHPLKPGLHLAIQTNRPNFVSITTHIQRFSNMINIFHRLIEK